MQKEWKRKCKICGERFNTNDLRRWWCCSDHGAIYATQQWQAKKKKEAVVAARAKRADLKARKEKLKTKNDLIKECQDACNAYIRIRDINKDCISCGSSPSRSSVGGGVDAGHYRPRGAAPHLRFYTLNIHSQCKQCNRYRGGNYSEYRKGFIMRYGIELVEKVESDQRVRNYTKEDVKRLTIIFRKKTRLLKKRVR